MKKSDFKKYGLDYAVLSEEFDLEKIDSLRDLLDKMVHRTYTYAGLIEDLLQPDNVASMHEANFLRIHHTVKINDVYKELMKLNRQLLLFRLNFSEDKFKEVSKTYMLQWGKIKPELQIILTEMSDSWNKTVIHKQDGGYLG